MILIALLPAILCGSPLDSLLDKQPVDKEIVLEITTTTTTLVTRIQQENQSTVTPVLPLLNSITIEAEKSSCKMVSSVKVEPELKCYVMSFESELSEAINIVQELGVENCKIYSNHINGISFCTQNKDIVKTLKQKINGAIIQEDDVYQVSSVQYPISNHLFIMKNYTNRIFNSYFFNNIIFEILQINKIFRFMFGTYNYYYTGKGVRIYALDTSVNVKTPLVKNLSGKKISCNKHGDITVDVLTNKERGFAKDSEVIVLDGVNCDGKIKLSEILELLEHVKKSGMGTVCLLGISGSYSEMLNKAVDTITRKGIFIITAAGNNHDNACFYSPSSAKTAITVGSVNKHTKISKFSNFGSCVRLYALGENIYENSNVFGTSCSAAIVAGAVAMYLQKFPNTTFHGIWNFLNTNTYWNENYLTLKLPHLSNENTKSSNFEKDIVNFDIILHIFMALVIIFLVLYIVLSIRTNKKKEFENDIVITRNKRSK